MMLRYVGLGKRRLGEQPMPAHPRLNWEFFAVVRGKLAPFEHTPKEAHPITNHLWLFPPGVIHGWKGESDASCEVIVAHFSSVPDAIAEVAAKYRVLETRLSRGDLKGLEKIAQCLNRHYWEPTLESDLRTQRALMDLCLLLLRNYAERTTRKMVGGSYDRVVAAEEWLRAHLPENPSISAAADHVGVSSSQLCRLFLHIRKKTPQEFLNRIKIEIAMELLGHSNAKLDKVAAESGFSSASNLCRAFKAAKGRSPTDWRRETFIQFKQAPKTSAADHTQFGKRVRPVL